MTYKEQYWRSRDWTKSNGELAREAGVDSGTVLRWRSKLGIRNPHRQGGTRYEWDSVNWAQPDTQIARDLGCTAPSVRYMRSKLGIPQPLDWLACKANEYDLSEREVVTLLSEMNYVLDEPFRTHALNRLREKGWNG